MRIKTHKEKRGKERQRVRLTTYKEKKEKKGREKIEKKERKAYREREREVSKIKIDWLFTHSLRPIVY